MHLIVGLGNPGKEYARSRHNIGFMCVDALAKQLGVRFTRHKAKALVADGQIEGNRVLLVKPQTFMNLSGNAVRPLFQASRIAPSDLLVILDDMDLPLGRLRLRGRGSAAGHRGLESIIQVLGTNEIPRLRVGIGRPAEQDPVDYVLGSFRPQETEVLSDVVHTAMDAICAFVLEGQEKAMNRFNPWNGVASPPAAPTEK